jgi:WD40 repeat protein
VTCSDDRTLVVWEWSEDPPRARWRNACVVAGHHARTVFSVDCDAAGDRIVTGCGDNAVRVFERVRLAVSLSCCAVAHCVCRVLVSVAAQDRSSDEPSFALLTTVANAHAADVNCVRWNRARPELLASCGDDNVVKIWQLRADMEL